jgi:hypothetical protein
MVMQASLRTALALEPLRAQQRVYQITEQEQSSNAGDDVVHWGDLLPDLQPVTSFGEVPATDEKQSSDQDVK